MKNDVKLRKAFGSRLHARRQELGLTLRGLSMLTERSTTALWQLEQGANEAMSSTVVQLCKALGCSADWLLGLASEVAISCPDCGPVKVIADGFEGSNPVTGKCPRCNERLYFA